MASQGPPGPDESKAGIVVGVVGALHIVSWTLFGTRIWTRVKPTFRLSPDDYFIMFAVAFDAVSFAFMLVSVRFGVGRHNYYLPADEEMLAEKWLFLSQPPFPWSLAFSKVSISWMLMRIQRDRAWWVWTMYFLMFVSVGVAVVSNIFQLSACRPLAAVWDHTIMSAVCNPPGVSQTSIYVTSSLTIVTDFVLSIAPLTFIITMQRPLREKIALAFVMGLGIFASSASIAKTFMIGSYGKTGDSLMDTVGLTTWSMVEAQLAIIAACIPTLKRFFESVLRNMGLISSEHSATRSRTGYLKHDDHSTRATASHTTARGGYDSHKLSAMRSQHDSAAKGSTAETDSIDSGEMPIMMGGPSQKGSVGDFRSVESGNGGANQYFRTAIRGGGEKGGSGGNGSQGIQMQTTVSVRTELKRRGDDNV
ncbi:hypothetical protein C8A05DRAFT_17904 [Staphylotrichum tortipilum]|uniref:Rhodopsin domain-containing protein n=1 Tax=Staphylotrichum tortipilum TaxID=2831512 RepID=A0AAN6MF46_9PEZI|nr:hypothetical protein C8A05DRAFT_17904 [Staphylotrichum longicolle]